MDDHIVSQGWQRNIAEGGHELAILNMATGLVGPPRPIKSNFAEPDFLTYTDSDGAPVRAVDAAFTKIERKVLNKVREIRVGNCKAEHRDAVADLFGIHLVRSNAMRASKLRLIANHGPSLAAELESDPVVQAKFLTHVHRLPDPGEILKMTHEWAQAQIGTNEYFVENLPRFQQQIRDILTRYHLQVVESAPSLPGFVLGDVPVVHALLGAQRFGFRDDLAIGDSDYVAAPISRRVAVLFSKDRLPAKVIQTKRLISKFNVMTLFAADREVACHPADARALHQLWLYREQYRSFDALVGR